MRAMARAVSAMAMVTKRTIARKRAMASSGINETTATETMTKKTMTKAMNTTKLTMMLTIKTKTTTKMTTTTVQWRQLAVAGGSRGRAMKAAAVEVECSCFLIKTEF
jgi:hypothetical protein